MTAGRRERKTVGLALEILKSTARSAQPRSDAVRLALYVVLPYVGKHYVTTYWSCTSHELSPHRQFNLSAQVRLMEAVCSNRLGGLG